MKMYLLIKINFIDCCCGQSVSNTLHYFEINSFKYAIVLRFISYRKFSISVVGWPEYEVCQASKSRTDFMTVHMLKVMVSNHNLVYEKARSTIRAQSKVRFENIYILFSSNFQSILFDNIHLFIKAIIIIYSVDPYV
jgi:hypothetical protein